MQKRLSKISVCVLEQLDEEKVIMVNSSGVRFSVDIDTYLEKKLGDIHIGDHLVMEYYDVTENEDGTVTPEVCLIQYDSLRPSRIV